MNEPHEETASNETQKNKSVNTLTRWQDFTAKQRELFEIKIDRSKGPEKCWPWTAFCDHAGYGKFSTCGKSPVGAHRIAYEAYVGPIPKNLLVCHRCDNPKCCNPTHLFVGTQQDNMSDKCSKKRQAFGLRNGSYTCPDKRPYGNRNGMRLHPESRSFGDKNFIHQHPEVVRGENNGFSILTEKQVREIKSLRGKIRRKQIGPMFGVSEAAIKAIYAGTNWSHVT